MVYGIYGIYHIVYGSGNYRFINHKTLYTTPLVARAALNYWIGLLCSSGCLGPGFLGEYAPKLCDSSRLFLGDETKCRGLSN